MAEKGLSTGGRVAATLGAGIVAAPASYIVQRALGAWGVLDDISDALGRWMKINVPPAAAGWTIALLVVVAIYGLILWRVWRPRHIHHLPVPTHTEPIASLEKTFIPNDLEERTLKTEKFTAALARERQLEALRPRIDELATSEQQDWNRVLSCCREAPADSPRAEHLMNADQMMQAWRTGISRVIDIAERITGKRDETLREPVTDFNPHQEMPDDSGIRNQRLLHDFRRIAHHRQRLLNTITRLRTTLEHEMMKAKAIITSHQ